jgi:hypothetical protein
MTKRKDVPPELQVGDGPIEDNFTEIMNVLAKGLDDALNPGLRGSERTTGFLLMVFPLKIANGRANYISNGRRQDIVRLLEDQLKRFKAQKQ